ncbi:MAG: hypothetical protein GX774_06790 [Armatimonadetes bacterium]|nr:hypothetical protein [Armatimonadota bacterium]
MAPLIADLCQHKEGNLYVPALDCWLDADTPRPKGFVSHAHTDHYAAHQVIICTPETAQLLTLVKPYGEALPPCRPLRLGREVAHGDARVRLLPSGHILGAAMLHLEHGGSSLLYAGDVRPSGSATAPPAAPLPADHLVVEDTFGALDEAFVDSREGAARVVEFCQSTRQEGATPVLVTMSGCGKAQEMVIALAAAGLTTALQSKIWHFTRLYARLGVPVPLGARLGQETVPDADVVLVTCAYLEHNDLGARLHRPKYALVSGWAATANARHYDAAIPWSDHASRAELLSFIEAVQPRLVWTFAGEGKLARELQAAGIGARHLA